MEIKYMLCYDGYGMVYVVVVVVLGLWDEVYGL